MGRMSSSEPSNRLDPEQQRTLIGVALASIDFGLDHGRARDVSPDDFPPPLREPRATFVTLRIHKDLRGCMGSLQADAPLVVGVSRNAYSSAFRDPRFRPLTREEFPRLSVHLSVLSRPEP